MKIKFTRFTAILVAVALLASALIGFAIGRVGSRTTTGFKNTASPGLPCCPSSASIPASGASPG